VIRISLAVLLGLAAPAAAAAGKIFVAAADPELRQAVATAVTASGFQLADGELKAGDAAQVAEAARAAGAGHAIAIACTAKPSGRIRATRLQGAEATCQGALYAAANAARLDDGKLVRAATGASAEAASKRARGEAAAALAARMIAAARIAAPATSPTPTSAAGITVTVARMSSFRDLTAFVTALADAAGEKGAPSPPELRRVTQTDVRYLARSKKSAEAIGAALARSSVAGLDVTVLSASGQTLTVALSTEVP